jgi:hypothetical protein
MFYTVPSLDCNLIIRNDPIATRSTREISVVSTVLAPAPEVNTFLGYFYRTLCFPVVARISLLIRDGSDYATVAQPRNLDSILDRGRSFRLVKAVGADRIFRG